VLSQVLDQHSAEIVVADFAKRMGMPAVKSTVRVITANPLGHMQIYATSAILKILLLPMATLVWERRRVLLLALSVVVADVFLREMLSATFNRPSTINVFFERTTRRRLSFLDYPTGGSYLRASSRVNGQQRK
jgi:hypothetical protein